MSPFGRGGRVLLGRNDAAEVEVQNLSRRKFMLRGLLGSSGLFVSGFLVRFLDLLRTPPAPGLRVLSEREVVILEALLTTFFPGGEMPKADLTFLVPRIDDFLRSTDSEAALLFRSMLHVVEDGARLSTFKTFSELGDDARLVEVRKWELTPVYLKRQAFRSIKLFAGIQYMEQPGVAKAMGWYVGCAPSHLSHKSKYRMGA